MKISLKTKQRLSQILLFAGVASLAPLLFTQKPIFIEIGTFLFWACVIASFAIMIFYLRCPFCNKRLTPTLDLSSTQYCPYCGKELI